MFQHILVVDINRSNGKQVYYIGHAGAYSKYVNVQNEQFLYSTGADAYFSKCVWGGDKKGVVVLCFMLLRNKSDESILIKLCLQILKGI